VNPTPTEPARTPEPDDPGGSRVQSDPVLAKRARVAKLVSVGQKVGYTLLGLFCVLVIICFPTGFPAALTTAAIVCIVLGSVVLAPAIVFGYGVKAADREDREGDWR
jgi:hypothetical protein